MQRSRLQSPVHTATAGHSHVYDRLSHPCTLQPRVDELVRKEVRRNPHADAKLDKTNKASRLKQIKQDLA